ncbi:MAG TPA: DUF721 domain-containing protein [Longimicrobiales bacterium]|nr:DUF721 domain-containing protein [Longimicrobiales bacterium]
MSGKPRGPQRVSEALAGYLDRSGLGDRIEEASAVDDWAERVGAKIAAVTEPLHVNNGVLFVAVRSSAWLMELRMMEKDVRRRLNEQRRKGRIQRIRFVMQGGGDEERRGWRGRRKASSPEGPDPSDEGQHRDG